MQCRNILGNGRLRLQIEPSVVERDFANAVVVDGITVPSFTVRKVSTQVEMNFGETLVIGGLVSKREEGTTSKLPFFGELPWIGALFSHKQYTEAETELIILVTPEYVAPMSPEQVPVGGPGKFTSAPTDHELFANGMLEVPRVGSDCDAVFNCSECQKDGFCHRHPNGRWSLGSGGSGNGYRSNPGCTDCAPGGSQPDVDRAGATAGRTIYHRADASGHSADSACSGHAGAGTNDRREGLQRSSSWFFASDSRARNGSELDSTDQTIRVQRYAGSLDEVSMATPIERDR